MKTWERETYKVEEVPFDHDLHQFRVIRGDEVLCEITPDSIDDMNAIIELLDAGESVQGWEDGMGNVVDVGEGGHP